MIWNAHIHDKHILQFGQDSQMLPQECHDVGCDLVLKACMLHQYKAHHLIPKTIPYQVSFEQEVPGIQVLNRDVRDIALIGIGPSGNEYWVLRTPEHNQWRLRNEIMDQ
jgi:hypothetical protein